ncbi:MAG TPA: transcription termination factor NusA [Candidatus Solibacter sp.]|jgi:N utilization substance protein A|nr:transcription termination factor NusA [Candidatus Solibacter sp.]
MSQEGGIAFGDLLAALDQLQQEKGFSKDALLEVVEQALAEAYRQRHEPEGEVEVRIDTTTGELRAGIHAAGGYEPIPPEQFQASAATTARKIIFSRLRDAEREQLFRDALRHQGELASAVVDRIDGEMVFVKTDSGATPGGTEAILPPEEQIPQERYHAGQRLKVLLLEPRVGKRGPNQVVSRANRGLVKRLLEFEVPEILSGAVVVKGLAREAGLRTKVAVESTEEGLDPVGACVGPKGARNHAIREELAGERVDIVEWSEEPNKLVANALGPARVNSVTIDVETRTATVMVPASHLSLAIGKDGQNARLAARLTGWRIDIKGEVDGDVPPPPGAAGHDGSEETEQRATIESSLAGE